MISTTPGIDGLIRELLDVLDQEIELLGLKRSAMASLSAAILDRDEGAIERLLADIERMDHAQQATDVKLSALRGSFAQALGKEAGELKLGALAGMLDGDAASAVDYRRRQILLLAQQLKAQHLQTSMLLHECARINRMLLETMLSGAGDNVETYSASGRDVWRGRGLMSAER